MLAAAYTSTHSDKVLRLVLAEPGFLTPEKFREYMELTNNLAVPINARTLTYMTKTWFQLLHVKGLDRDARTDYLYLNLVIGLLAMDHTLAGYWADPVKVISSLPFDRYGIRAATVFPAKYFNEEGNLIYNFIEKLTVYRDEVLFIAGENDRIIGPEYQRGHMKHFPRARMEVIPDSGHNMFNENPEYTFAVIRKYLSQ